MRCWPARTATQTGTAAANQLTGKSDVHTAPADGPADAAEPGSPSNGFHGDEAGPDAPDATRGVDVSSALPACGPITVSVETPWNEEPDAIPVIAIDETVALHGVALGAMQLTTIEGATVTQRDWCNGERCRTCIAQVDILFGLRPDWIGYDYEELRKKGRCAPQFVQEHEYLHARVAQDLSRTYGKTAAAAVHTLVAGINGWVVDRDAQEEAADRVYERVNQLIAEAAAKLNEANRIENAIIDSTANVQAQLAAMADCERRAGLGRPRYTMPELIRP